MTTPNPREVCRSCGEPWAEHLGIFVTCAKLQVAIRALREIATVQRTLDGDSDNSYAAATKRRRIAIKALKEIGQ